MPKNDNNSEKVWNFEGLNEEERIALLKTIPFPDPPTYDYPMEPPWKVFPDYSRFSMGWRMGPGEGFIMEYRSWFKALTDKETFNYKEKHKEPEEWVGFFDSIKQ